MTLFAKRIRLIALGLLAIAPIEVIAHAVVRSRIPSDDDWTRAAEFVRSQYKDGDAITSEPRWTDPIVRLRLGDIISLQDAGRSDLSAYKRLWMLSIDTPTLSERDQRSVQSKSPSETRVFGRIVVRQWPLKTPTEMYNFVSLIQSAQVSVIRGTSETRCLWTHTAPTQAGGLWAGPYIPQNRFQCDPQLWVGATVIEDLDLSPRYCIWQHPAANGVVRVRFANVPRGKALVIYHGLYYDHERWKTGAPVTMDVSINQRAVSRIVHHDGDGWKRSVVPIVKTDGSDNLEILFDVFASQTDKRSFCWYASMHSSVEVEP